MSVTTRRERPYKARAILARCVDHCAYLLKSSQRLPCGKHVTIADLQPVKLAYQSHGRVHRALQTNSSDCEKALVAMSYRVNELAMQMAQLQVCGIRPRHQIQDATNATKRAYSAASALNYQLPSRRHSG
ncbi:hypothetical protein T10_4122 [Trichinella papuae]|uniref:Uncharacterized protein n=1 Tax=Trichinella papuae TaxID=268474 RepID=A0A0V1MHD3_9BILA|nr:hypothetical protein T10_981 [Trichinella papuae]KRZ71300.1 hypothetical protein T10_11664 [Trichinella papuae]KRZ77423.1 hypothetical protein T10_4122 [Trichinella papuae]